MTSLTKTQMAWVGAAGAGYIVSSATLINFNKWLLSENRFPYPLQLVLFHSFVTSSTAAIAFGVRPSAFTSLIGAERAAINPRWLLKNVLPIAFLFSMQLVLSNTSYMHSSVAFLQMMKECNIVIVYLLSVIFAIEALKWQNAHVILCVLAATMITLKGEMNFSMTGFQIQACSQVFESLKITLQGFLLADAGRKLDPLTYTLLVNPCCCLVLATMLLVLVYLIPGVVMIPAMKLSHLAEYWPLLLCNGAVAVCLNMVTALLVRKSSAVAFVLTGIVKDTCIVVGSAMFLSEQIGGVQAAGFALQILMILLYSLLKMYPEEFKHGSVHGLVNVCTMAIVSRKAQHLPSLHSEGAMKLTTADETVPLVCSKKRPEPVV